MDNDRTLNESDVQDENLRDRNITDSGARISSGTKSRSESGTINSIEDEVDTNDDTSTQSEDISSRSDLGVGE